MKGRVAGTRAKRTSKAPAESLEKVGLALASVLGTEVRTVRVVPMARKAVWAVTRVHGDPDVYQVTHIPSGLKVPDSHTRSPRAARKLMNMLARRLPEYRKDAKFGSRRTRKRVEDDLARDVRNEWLAEQPG